jgi:ribosomal protein L7/L12
LHLQNFLEWVFEKSLATQSSLQMCASRAFYFALACGAELTMKDHYDLAGNFYIDESIKKAIFFHDTCCHEESELLADYLLYQAVNESTGSDLVFRWGDLADELIMMSDETQKTSGGSYTSYLWHCINFDGFLSSEEIFDRHNFDEWMQKYCPENIFHKEIFQAIQALIKHRADLDAMFEREYNEGIDEKTYEFSSSWWNQNQTKLSDDLRSILIRHRNIAHDWQFNGLQTRQLHLYYEANLLIVKCLKRCNANLQITKEIENTLLLPIAEIERIKRCPGFPDLEPNLQVSKIPACEASEYYQVILHLSNESLEVRVAVLKVVRRVSGLGIKDAKNIIESKNAIVVSGVHKIVAEYVKYKIEKASGIASIEKTDNLGDIPNNELFLPDFIDELEFYEVLTTEQKQEWKNRCIFASERRKRVKQLDREFLRSRKN